MRNCGRYSHRRRGLRSKPRQEGATEDEAETVAAAESGPILISRWAITSQRLADDGPRAGSVSTWARLSQRFHAVDPFARPQCGIAMMLISFIELLQQDVTERILRHCSCGRARFTRWPILVHPHRSFPKPRCGPLLPCAGMATSDDPTRRQLAHVRSSRKTDCS